MNQYEYRDLLELWTAWWNGPGRKDFMGDITPPLTRTAYALNCVICHGVDSKDTEGERCQSCGRLIGGSW